MSAALEQPEILGELDTAQSNRFDLESVWVSSAARNADQAHLLSPIDLQVVKACGVTFVESMVERVIEEKCAGDSARAAEVRESILRSLGGSLSGVEPGSERAQAIKSILIAEGLWSAYLEVGIWTRPRGVHQGSRARLGRLGGEGRNSRFLVVEQRRTGTGSHREFSWGARRGHSGK